MAHDFILPMSGPQRSVSKYIRSIDRNYFGTVVVMTFLIGLTHQTMMVALERHNLQHSIGYVTSNQFIRFQKLANQTRALMRASSNPELPEYIIDHMRNDVGVVIEEMRAASAELDAMNFRISRNYMERMLPPDPDMETMRGELNTRLESFLQRAERVAGTSTRERRERYSYWGAVDFAAAADGALMKLFEQLNARSYERSTASIWNAKWIGTALLTATAAVTLLAALFLFRPLLAKLSHEHQRTVDYQEQLSWIASTDPLTGLGNRSRFNKVLSEQFAEINRRGGGFSALMFDLDRFKSVNDSIGHSAGDAVLRHVASAARQVVRSEDVVVRLGGDEFALLLPNITDTHVLREIANRLRVEISKEFQFEGRSLQTSASIGGVVAPIHADNETALLRLADLALHSAKALRAAPVIFDEAALAEQLDKTRLSMALAMAAENDEFVVHYQRKVALGDGAHRGFEALVRWQHPTLGLLPPSRFLGLMEGTHLAKSMTRSIIRVVSRDLKSWKNAGLLPGPVAINLPEALLLSDECFRFFEEAIDEHQLCWTDFAVEITEDVFLDRHAEKILSNVARLQKQQVSVSLDDFGTGFASLVHLRDFPFDELKIDRSFVMNADSDPKSRQIISAIVDLSRHLGKKCVAEGIETEAQRDFLLRIGCEIGQGFLLSRPESADSARSYLRHLQNPPPERQPSLRIGA